MVILGKHSGQTHKGVPSTNDGVVIPMANCRSAVPVSNEKHRYMDTMSTQNDEIQLAGVLMWIVAPTTTEESGSVLLIQASPFCPKICVLLVNICLFYYLYKSLKQTF